MMREHKTQERLFPFFQSLRIDWILFFSAVIISVLGLLTMASFQAQDTYLERQVIWLCISILVFFLLSAVDYSFLKKTKVVVLLFLASAFLLAILFVVGHISRGAQSWFNYGGVSFQPSNVAKLVLIIILAKYFSKRHIEIANIRHILVSALYAFIFFILILMQPAFGDAFIIFMIWLGMILVSGVSKKHLLLVFLTGAVTFSGLWIYVLRDYQKKRIENFIHPLTDVSGSGYNAYQATIAIGSGKVFGKGIGYGTQSRLKFLPEYKTDFIFAAYAEEWGLVGVFILFLFFGILIWRIIHNAYFGATNFEILFGLGLAIMFMSHFLVNAGMCLGLLPVTGINFPFMSYGGTNLLTSFAGLGMLMGMRRYGRGIHTDETKKEFLGL